MSCPNCGKPTREGASFCGNCGFKLSTATAAEPAVAEVTPEPAPLHRPPPPPPEDEPVAVPQVVAPEPAIVVPEVVASEPAAIPEPAVIPDPAPLLIPPPPPASTPKEVEIVPFGSPVAEPVESTIQITAPPPGAPPPASAATAAPKVESLDETRVSARRRAGVHWRLVLPDGKHVEVVDALLVGRDASANPKWPAAALLSVDDDDHSVSKTHAVFEVDAKGLWVTDLDSTNGVVISQPDGTEVDLDPNVRALIQPGADVELGDFIVQVEKD